MTTTATSRAAWIGRAACAGLDNPDALFYPRTQGASLRQINEATRQAKRVCAGCPVRAECLEDAMTREANDAGGRWGISGGMTEEEREQLAVERGHIGRQYLDVAVVEAMLTRDPWLTTREVADRLGFTPSGVRARLRRGERLDLLNVLVTNGVLRMEQQRRERVSA